MATKTTNAATALHPPSRGREITLLFLLRRLTFAKHNLVGMTARKSASAAPHPLPASPVTSFAPMVCPLTLRRRHLFGRPFDGSGQAFEACDLGMTPLVLLALGL
jgi:hypothetical protein